MAVWKTINRKRQRRIHKNRCGGSSRKGKYDEESTKKESTIRNLQSEIVLRVIEGT